jgi:hypothetical protein
MKTNDLSGITTMDELRAVRKSLEAEISADEAEILSRLRIAQSILSPSAILLPVIRKIRGFLIDR